MIETGYKPNEANMVETKDINQMKTQMYGYI